MITNKIKSVQLKKAIDKLKKNRQFATNTSNRVLLVISEDNFKVYGSLQNLWKSLGLSANAFDVVICGSLRDLDDKNLLQVSFKDLGLDGEFKNKDLSALLENEFGSAILVSGAETLLSNYVVLRSGATFLIGKSPDPFSILDVEIFENDPSLLEAELIRYYKILKHKK
ncbi:hypothetical protein [uncultured Christiangramia sp.]|uniref:DUF6913 domain-containing protein n=1 Tax=uncultured Christiangramia sp. TaxID=503836 RepID=UPI002629EB0F|nr:hypothetical protein [uncultured Christiangramia sp.]